jgi:urease accessory protein
MRTGQKSALLGLAMMLVPAMAHAHTGIGATDGFAHGFAHPIGGVDHMLAMVAVGTFAALMGGRAVWLVPLSFVAMMAFGGVLGIEGIAVPFVEIGIAASVVALGLAIALRWSPPVIAAMALAGVFAIFHGHAHGAEMPMDASGLGYAAGFMLATALLHAAGIGVGLAAGRFGARSVLAARTAGAATALAGVAILAGYL